MAPSSQPILNKGGAIFDVLHEKGKMFLFFDLPRELRDMIYDHMLTRTKTVTSTEASQVRVSRLPNNEHLLRLNHKFREELKARMAKFISMTINILDPYDFDLTLPQNHQSIPKVNLHVDLSKFAKRCFRAGRDRFLINSFLCLRCSILYPLLCDNYTPQIRISMFIPKGAYARIYTPGGIHPKSPASGEAHLLAYGEQVAAIMQDECVKGLDVYTGKPTNLLKGGTWPKDAVLCMKYSFETGGLERVDGYVESE